jgi:orotate phosphoribosyltransferase
VVAILDSIKSNNSPWTSIDISILKNRLLDLLCQAAYKEGDFTLSTGKSSAYYIDGKQVTLHPEGSVAVGRVLLDLLPQNTDAIAGLTLGADPIVTSVAIVGVYEGRSITPLIIRKEAKEHGTQAYIEGPTLKAGSSVIVLDDVVTTGQSAMKAVERLRNAGYKVEKVMALVDRQQGGAEFYESQGLEFEPVFTIQELQKRWRELNP